MSAALTVAAGLVVLVALVVAVFVLRAGLAAAWTRIWAEALRCAATVRLAAARAAYQPRHRGRA